MEELTSKEIQDLKNSSNDWNYVDLKQFARRINRLLRTTSIQQHYDRVTRAFWDLRRWEIISKHNANYLPKPVVPLEGKDFVFPAQVDGCDWRWEIRGRHPIYFDYCLHSACHWLAEANYQLAIRLFPEMQWEIMTNVFHTSVLNTEYQLLFDLNYQALQVPAYKAVSLLIKPDPEGDMPHLYTDGSQYSCSELTVTSAAIKLWEMIDSMDGTDEQKLELIQKARFDGIFKSEKDTDVKQRMKVAKPLAELRSIGV